MTKRIELARSEDGRETIFSVSDPGSFPSNARIQIRWFGENKSLGPSGWQNAAHQFISTSSRSGSDLLFFLDANLTNRIQRGTGVEILIPELGISEQLVWGPLPGLKAAIIKPPETVGDLDKLSRAMEDLSNVRRQLDEREKELEAVRDEMQGVRNELGKKSPLTRVDWRQLAAALMVGLVLGTSGMYAYGYFGEHRRTDGEGVSVAALQNDLARLKTEAFAPLASDLIQVADVSPGGQTPDQVAGRGLPPERAALAYDRARTFLNHGLELAASRNITEAVYWYRQSLRLCAADAFLYLGDAYFNGDGAARDPRSGFQLMRISSGLGSRRAAELLKQKIERQEIPLAPSNFGDLYRQPR